MRGTLLGLRSVGSLPKIVINKSHIIIDVNRNILLHQQPLFLHTIHASPIGYLKGPELTQTKTLLLKLGGTDNCRKIRRVLGLSKSIGGRRDLVLFHDLLQFSEFTRSKH